MHSHGRYLFTNNSSGLSSLGRALFPLLFILQVSQRNFRKEEHEADGKVQLEAQDDRLKDASYFGSASLNISHYEW